MTSLLVLILPAFVVFDDRGEPYAVATHADPDGPLRFYNPLSDFVGEYPRTQVRRVVRG